MSITRRSTCGLLSAGLLSPGLLFAEELKHRDDVHWEEQRGDPALPYEAISINGSDISKNSGTNKATFLPRQTSFGAMMLAEAENWLGKTRRNARGDITNLLELFDCPFEQQGKPVPFCAAGVSYVSALIYARTDKLVKAPYGPDKLVQYLGDVEHHHFGTSPSVIDIAYLARGKRRWILPADGRHSVQAGWLAVFDFGGGFDHVGIVERIDGNNVHTIEFNTVADGAVGYERDGGAIARKTRNIRLVKGFVNTSMKTR